MSRCRLTARSCLAAPTATTVSASGLVDGLVSRWDELADAGIPVAALTDTFVRAAAPALEAPLRDLVTGSR